MRFSTLCFIVAGLGLLVGLSTWLTTGFYDSIDSFIAAIWAFMYGHLYREKVENDNR